METVLKAIADWIKGILTAGIMSNLSGLFDDVNTQVGNIAQQVGTKPSSFEPRVFAMIEALSRNVVLPIAGIILTFIKREAGKELSIDCTLEVTEGTAKVFWISGSDEAVTLIEATGTYSDTITLPDGGNYIGIECESFTGSIELNIE